MVCSGRAMQRLRERQERLEKVRGIIGDLCTAAERASGRTDIMRRDRHFPYPQLRWMVWLHARRLGCGWNDMEKATGYNHSSSMWGARRIGELTADRRYWPELYGLYGKFLDVRVNMDIRGIEVPERKDNAEEES